MKIGGGQAGKRFQLAWAVKAVVNAVREKRVTWRLGNRCSKVGELGRTGGQSVNAVGSGDT